MEHLLSDANVTNRMSTFPSGGEASLQAADSILLAFGAGQAVPNLQDSN